MVVLAGHSPAVAALACPYRPLAGACKGDAEREEHEKNLELVLAVAVCEEAGHVDRDRHKDGKENAEHAREDSEKERGTADDLERHPEDAATMPLYRMATRLRAVPFRRFFKWLAADVAKSESFPLAVRGRALKTWRALVYSEAL